MSSDYRFSNEIQKVLRYIGNNFVNSDNKTQYTGSVNSSGLTFVESIINGYESFKNKYTRSLPTVVNINTISNIFVHQLNREDVYTAYNITSSYNPSNTEINYSKLLVPGSALLIELNKVRNAYIFLSDSNLDKWKSGNTTFNVSNYSIITNNNNNNNNNNTKSVVLNFTDAKTNIELVLGSLDTFDFIQNDVFMIRRMLLLYELMSNIYISMYLYETYSLTSGATEVEKGKYVKIISDTANILITLNNNFNISSDDTPTQRSNIIKNLNKNIQNYKTNSDAINVLDDTIRDQKIELNSNQSLYRSTRMSSNRTSKYAKLIITIYVISIIAIIAIALSPLEKISRLVLCSGILIAILLLAVILNNIYNKNTEGFEGEEGFEDEEGFEGEEEFEIEEGFDSSFLQDTGVSSTGENRMTLQNTLEVYNQAFLSEALDYLNITIYLGALLQSNNTYSNINNTINRELTYFNQAHDMIENTNNKMKGAVSIAELDRITQSARATFFIQLGIILSIGIILYIVAGDNILYQPYLFAIVGLFIILAIFVYLMKVSKRVRTSPKQFYWDRPSNISMLNL